MIILVHGLLELQSGNHWENFELLHILFELLATQKLNPTFNDVGRSVVNGQASEDGTVNG